MSRLQITCRFVANSYQGRRLTDEQREGLDWPPSPGRLHQALMSAALTGRNAESTETQPAVKSIRWLESLPPPEIVSSRLLADAETRPRVAIPQNSPPKGNDLLENATLLEPRYRAVSASGMLMAKYEWTLGDQVDQDAAIAHRESLDDLVAQLAYLGRAEDRIEATLAIVEDGSPAENGQSTERWRPVKRNSDVDLYVARVGSTDSLIRRHASPQAPRERKVAAQRFLAKQGFRRDCASPMLPTVVSIFQLFHPSDDPDPAALSCDPEGAWAWRGPIRELAIRVARIEEYWDDPAVALELVSGHQPGKTERAEQPHLAFVPLPSFNASGTADGRVRRVALLGYASPVMADQAEEIYETIAASLDGEIIDVEGAPARLHHVFEASRNDKIWSQLVRPSRVWQSLTPVALARRFSVPTFAPDGETRLSGDQRHRRRLEEWTSLIRDSLRHMCLPERLVVSCAVTLSYSPLLRGTARAERYRAPNEAAVLTHAQLEFPEPVRGPLLIGDRRYKGLGLFAPR
jgi:CRISPR-associated protein Csb2